MSITLDTKVKLENKLKESNQKSSSLRSYFDFVI